MSIGLLIFVIINILNVLTLLLDLYFLRSGQRTITDRVRKDMMLGVSIIIMELFMVAGLAVHFFEETAK